MRFGKLLLVLAALVITAPSNAQHRFAEVEVRTEEIRDGVAVLFGAGGNVAVAYGEDATVLVDDQYAEMTQKLQNAIDALGATPVRFLINTHWHYDHAGGNANFGEAGAVILAHDKVRVRMLTGGQVGSLHVDPETGPGLPVVTYSDGITLHLNGEQIDALFVGGGHTDGDSVVVFRKANVIHTGDLFITSGPIPFIDGHSGGDIHDLITTLGRIIAMADEDTVIIPGHGPLGTKAELVTFTERLATLAADIAALRAEGLTEEEAVARRPIDPYAPGYPTGYLDAMVRTIWRSLPEE